MVFERVSREDKKRSWVEFVQFASISRADADSFLAQTRSIQLRILANCRDQEGQLWIRFFSSVDHFRNIGAVRNLNEEKSVRTMSCRRHKNAWVFCLALWQT